MVKRALFQLCYLVRLDYGSSWKATNLDNNRNKTGGGNGDSTSNKWRHLVIENLNNATGETRVVLDDYFEKLSLVTV